MMATKLDVLLVEDSDDDAALILRELAKGGYAVEHRRVFTRDAMAQALDERRWDVVLADHKMPSFNSVDALALVRGRKLDVPFIIVSGAIGEETAVAAMKAGAHDFVMKGNLARLVPAIGRELREAEDRRLRAGAEERARMEGERAQHYLDIAGTMVRALDAGGTVTLINRKGCEILGRPENEIVGKNWFDDFLPPGVREEIRTMFQKYLAGDGPEHWENVVLTKSGEERIIAWHNATLRDGSGKAIGTLSSGEDITVRTKAEEVLRESEERFRAMFEQAAVGIAQVAPDGRWLRVNQRWCDILGYTREELLARSFQDITHPEDVGGNLANMRKLLSNEIMTLSTEKRYIRKDRSIVWVNLTVSLQREATGAPKYFISVIEEITMRKEAEEALRKSEQLFRLLAENAKDMIYRVRLHPVPAVEYISPSALALTGHSPEEFLADGALALRLLPPKAREPQQKTPRMKGNLGGPVTMRWPRSDGVTVWLELVNHPVLDAAGKLVAVEGVGRNMTERKLVEDSLQESEEKFRNLAEQSPNMIFINVKGRVVYANRRWVEVMGYTREEFCSPGFDFISVVIAPEFRDTMREKYRKHLSKQDLTPDEHVVIAKDGRRIPVILSTTLIRYGGETAILGTLTDITELKRSEEALKKSQEKYRELVENINDVIFSTDQNGIYSYVSPAVERILGFLPNELTGKNITEFILAEDQERLWADFGATLAGELRPSEYRMKTKTGEFRWVRTSSRPLSADGAVSGLSGLMVDITERKQSEEQMRASLKEKVVLLKEIHHRVKNNLQIIYSLLNMQARNVNNPAVIGAIRESQNRVRTMALIHERLYMSSNLSDIDLREYITQLLHELYSSYGADPDRIRPELELADVRMGVDPAIPCGLIVNELISNSLKYAFPEGGKGAIRIGLQITGNGAIRLEVGDTGAGLPEGLDFQKTGSLGLQLVCSLVAQLRGTIRLESRQGTNFVIEFNSGMVEAG
jgi:PAS domain S-box-containing protein